MSPRAWLKRVHVELRDSGALVLFAVPLALALVVLVPFWMLLDWLNSREDT